MRSTRFPRPSAARLFLLLALVAAGARAQDCAQVPEPYRAQCEAHHRPQGAPLDAAGMGGQMQDALGAMQSCQGKTGNALKTCVVQNSSGSFGEANCAALPAERQAGCESMRRVTADAREHCKARFDGAALPAFEACVREEIGRQRPH